ncbi:uncharacterized protein PFLUO_LOCUS1673 [Penicillium psychrofluorescens]|uniref:uncharacterized protein n=1 Tax=Penicillium psychrofluorescens TaxID=3158075 RepID=UPI003CCD7268
MPPRIPLQPSLKALSGSFHGHNSLAASSPAQTFIRAKSTKPQSRKRLEPFLLARVRQRKAANISRQKVLKEEREGSIGDPVASTPTPFIEEIQARQSELQPPSAAPGSLNYAINSTELERALQFSKDLAEPLENPNRDTADPQHEKEALELHDKEHRDAQEAIDRIVNLNNANSKDHVRLNIQKCIEQFGRHNTDSILPPKPSAVLPDGATLHSEKVPRVGRDTGSAEVQAAILTVKILNLSRHLETSNKDKHNKRNLQILVHKRQKLLRYVRQKERGGPRWQHLIETLGLSDATWKGEVAL